MLRLTVVPVTFIRVDKSIDPVQLVHGLCEDAQANPDQKRGRFLKRMTPVTSVRKTLSVDLPEFAKEILKPHFHSGGGPKKVSFSRMRMIIINVGWRCLRTMSRCYVMPHAWSEFSRRRQRLLIFSWRQYAIRPSVRSNEKFSRDVIIKTVADAVGAEHKVDLTNYDLVILVDVVQVSLPPAHVDAS
jgi:tRNA acetyltransferase TAN1